MPSLVDIFNPSFLMFLGIMVLVVALLVVYFESKMREQNHKITSMFSLVSSMADELNAVKYNVSLVHANANTANNANNANSSVLPAVQNIPFSQELKKTSKLIHVSDDELEEEEEDSDSGSSEEDTENGSGSESEMDENDDDDNDDDNDDNEIVSLALSEVGSEENFDNDHEIQDLDDLSTHENIKVLKMEPSLLSSGGDHLFESIVLEEASDDDSSSSSSSSDEEELVTMEEVEVLKEEEPVERTEEQNKTEEKKNDMLDLKTISISNLDDIKMETDYKKMSIGRLRKIVQDKGLIEDSSKLKKNEILKLLGSSE